MKKSLTRWMLRCGIVLLAIVGLGSAAFAPVSAQGGAARTTPELIQAAQERGAIDADTAHLYLAYAFAAYDRLPAEYRSDAPWDGTLPLLSLHQSVGDIQNNAIQDEVKSLLGLSQPSATTTDCGGVNTSLPSSGATTNFYIEYGTIGGGLSILDYASALETSWGAEVASFGWAAPPVLASNPPPGNRYHVRIAPLGGGLYGFVSSSGAFAGFVGDNPNTAWNDQDAYASCMVLNDDYSGFPSPPLASMQSTAAHEFNHSLQFGYGGLDDLGGTLVPGYNFVEGGASWMEDEVFDSANDNYYFLWPDFTQSMENYTSSPYAYWVIYRAMTERFGTGNAGGGEQVMQDFWEDISRGTSGSDLEALDAALENKGTNLNDAYHYAAVALKFNKSCGGGYSYPYCLEEGPGYVGLKGATPLQGSIGAAPGSFSGSVRDSYALNWVSLPASGTYDVSLENTSGGGQLRGSLACDTGSALDVFPLSAIAGPGDTVTLTGFNASGCASVAAVITNQSTATTGTSRSYQISLQPVSSGPVDIILDNTGPEFWKSGGWSTYNGSAPQIGSNLYYTNSGSATAQWTPNLPSSDDYEVFVWLFRVGNGSTDQPFTITHAGGTTAPITVNWRTAASSGAWYSLGTYSLNAGTSGKVMTSGVNGGGLEIADAVRFVSGGTATPTATTPPPTTPPPSEIILDDGGLSWSGADFSGSWMRRTDCAAQNYGNSLRVNAAGSGNDYATFRPTIPSTGTYEVWVWVFKHSLGSPNAPYTVVYSGGSQTFSVNFNGANCGGGAWIYLGTFTFEAGTSGYVRVNDGASGGYVFADAVKFVPVP